MTEKNETCVQPVPYW